MSSTIATEGRPADRHDECRIRIAAAGDIHYGERSDDRERAAAAFEGLAERADVVLLAGDLTTHGEPEQAQIVADAVRDLDVPVLTVLGNHDWHVNRADEFAAVLEDAGVIVMDKHHNHDVLDLCETQVGIVGTKGFMGGFPGSHLPDFGEPSLRGVYAESMEEAAALDEGLRAVAMCPFRIVLLHYAPTRRRWRASGARSGRSSAPTAWPRRSSSTTPTWSCTATPTRAPSRAAWARCRSTTSPCPVMGEDWWVFELAGERRVPSEVH